MPRSAAALLGLALVALSIGFNTVRYPVVWEMVNATAPSDRAEATHVADVSQCLAETPTLPPTPIEIAAAPHVGEEAAARDLQSATAENVGVAAAQPEPQKGLVPVVPVALSRPSSEYAAGAGVRRLPPVTAGYANPANFAQSLGGSIPVYPTTGIE